MEFSSVTNLNSRKSADILVLPFFKTKKGVEKAAEFANSLAHFHIPVDAHDFKAKEGEVLVLYANGNKEKRIALLGLGEKEMLNVEKLRRSYASLTKICAAKKISSVNILPPQLKALSETDIIRGISEGMLLANYVFTRLKHDALKKDSPVLLKQAALVGIGKKGLEMAQECVAICKGVYLARDLVNGNADDITPQFLAGFAQDLSKAVPRIKTKVLHKKEIEKEKMGLLLAVNRGSSREPVLITMEYKGNPKSSDRTLLVGKGITYDTGGLNLKPTGRMETMKCDMGGSAVVLATMAVIASLGLKVNVVGIIPSTENSIGSNSYKPGDVYKSYSGKTVEIGNTDAEGRLVLADAVAYGIKTFKPKRVIDLATLTGAVDVALGSEAAGLLSNNDSLADALIQSSQDTFERIWRLPLFEEYRLQLKSDFADIKNIGGPSAGCITGGMFIQEFVGDTPWAHIDIASMAYLSDAKRYNPKFATGFGVRLMVNYFKRLKST